MYTSGNHISPYRRHLKACPHRSKGYAYTLCHCPIWADGKINGKRHRRSLDTNDWPTAATRLKRLESGEEAVTREAAVSLRAAADRFLAACEKRNLRASTCDLYKRALANLPDVSLDAVTTEDLQRVLDGRPIQPATKFLEGNITRIFFRWAVRQKLMAESPATALELPRNESAPTLPFTREEVAALLANCDGIRDSYGRSRIRALLLLLLYSGLRISDAAALRRSALEPATGYLTLRRIIKTGVPLKVKLPAEAVDALRKLPAIHPDYFFWDGKQPIRSLCQYLRQSLERVGNYAGVEDARPHRARDTFACELLVSGADIRTLQMLLGHKTVQTTEKSYAHFVASHQNLLDGATAKLSFALAAAPVLMHTDRDRFGNT